eukprot:TRINITY_DN82551_c0_g1_i1.p1 TRINITY_DN82551_c0_g1~~TRINITY_DN82551_c0_g1_i1.p1  ORF type:complete len:1503 (-),score=489.35 TRINITY_DN82551_c0_g1_i1:201-4709(-)
MNALFRIQKLQRLVKDNDLAGLFIIPGIDGAYNLGSQMIAKYIFLGGNISTQSDIYSTIPDEHDHLENMLMLIQSNKIHIFYDSDHSDFYKSAFGLCSVVEEMSVSFSCGDMDIVEDLKIKSFLSMVSAHGTTKHSAFTLTPGWTLKNAGNVNRIADFNAPSDQMEIENWPIVQAFALTEFASGGFYTMKHKIADVFSKVLSAVRVVDASSLTQICNYSLPSLFQHWNESLVNVEHVTPSSRLLISESQMAEPIVSQYEFAHLLESQKESTTERTPHILFGTRTNNRIVSSLSSNNSDEDNESQYTIEDSGFFGHPATHCIMYSKDPTSGIAVARTYFFSCPPSPENCPVPSLRSQRDELDDNWMVGHVMFLKEVYQALLVGFKEVLNGFALGKTLTEMKKNSFASIVESLPDTPPLTPDIIAKHLVLDILHVNDGSTVKNTQKCDGRLISITLRLEHIPALGCPSEEKEDTVDLGSVEITETVMLEPASLGHELPVAFSDNCLNVARSATLDSNSEQPSIFGKTLSASLEVGQGSVEEQRFCYGIRRMPVVREGDKSANNQVVILTDGFAKHMSWTVLPEEAKMVLALSGRSEPTGDEDELEEGELIIDEEDVISELTPLKLLEHPLASPKMTQSQFPCYLILPDSKDPRALDGDVCPVQAQFCEDGIALFPSILDATLQGTVIARRATLHRFPLPIHIGLPLVISTESDAMLKVAKVSLMVEKNNGDQLLMFDLEWKSSTGVVEPYLLETGVTVGDRVNVSKIGILLPTDTFAKDLFVQTSAFNHWKLRHGDTGVEFVVEDFLWSTATKNIVESMDPEKNKMLQETMNEGVKSLKLIGMKRSLVKARLLHEATVAAKSQQKLFADWPLVYRCGLRDAGYSSGTLMTTPSNNTSPIAPMKPGKGFTRGELLTVMEQSKKEYTNIHVPVVVLCSNVRDTGVRMANSIKQFASAENDWIIIELGISLDSAVGAHPPPTLSQQHFNTCVREQLTNGLIKLSTLQRGEGDKKRLRIVLVPPPNTSPELVLLRLFILQNFYSPTMAIRIPLGQSTVPCSLSLHLDNIVASLDIRSSISDNWKGRCLVPTARDLIQGPLVQGVLLDCGPFSKSVEENEFKGHRWHPNGEAEIEMISWVRSECKRIAPLALVEVVREISSSIISVLTNSFTPTSWKSLNNASKLLPPALDSTRNLHSLLWSPPLETEIIKRAGGDIKKLVRNLDGYIMQMGQRLRQFVDSSSVSEHNKDDELNIPFCMHSDMDAALFRCDTEGPVGSLNTLLKSMTFKSVSAIVTRAVVSSYTRLRCTLIGSKVTELLENISSGKSAIGELSGCCRFAENPGSLYSVEAHSGSCSIKLMKENIKIEEWLKMPVSFVATGAALKSSSVVDTLMACRPTLPVELIPSSVEPPTEDELKILKEKAHELPLPNGYWFDGVHYVNAGGIPQVNHPKLQDVVEEFMVEKRQSTSNDNKRILTLKELASKELLGLATSMWWTDSACEGSAIQLSG